MVGKKIITIEDVKRNPETIAFVDATNKYLGEIGYTEHGQRHADLASNIAHNILSHLEYKDPLPELAAIAGYLHDIGNFISRTAHGVSGAILAMDILDEEGMAPEEIALVISAIGNHEEEIGDPVNPVCAALILGDKSDVHRSRVRNPNMATFDIHDRVNFAAERSFLKVDKKKRLITLSLTIDTSISQVMEYFEIFLSRMIICRRAAEYLKCKFELVINNTKLL